MADEKKTEASTKPKAAAKPAAKPPAAAKAAAPKAPKAAKAPKAPKVMTARSKATPAVTDGPTCKVEGCKQGVRAKGLCRKHFLGWRRGSLGDHHRYKICSKEACRKPATFNGRCEEHTRSKKKAGEGAPAAA